MHSLWHAVHRLFHSETTLCADWSDQQTAPLG
jgi:hypothetical protein